MTVCSYHVTYARQSESALHICLNLKELLALNRRKIWILSVHLRTKWLCVRVSLQSLKLQISRACFEQEVPWHSGKYRVKIHTYVSDMIRTYSHSCKTFCSCKTCKVFCEGIYICSSFGILHKRTRNVYLHSCSCNCCCGLWFAFLLCNVFHSSF